MDATRLARLTEQQRLCLRYVFAHMTSKEIAPLLGIEPNSVDQHIKAAMRMLDAPDRRSAAKLLAEYERPASSQPSVYQSLDIAIVPDPATFAPPIEGRRHGGSLGEAMREDQAVFRTALPIQRSALPLRTGEARPDDVGILTRLAWIVGIAIGIAVAFGGLVGGVEALTRLFRG